MFAFIFVLLSVVFTWYLMKAIFIFLDKKVEKAVESFSGTLTSGLVNSISNTTSLIRGKMRDGKSLKDKKGIGTYNEDNGFLGQSTEEEDEKNEINKLKDEIKQLKNNNVGNIDLKKEIEDELNENDRNEAIRDSYALKKEEILNDKRNKNDMLKTKIELDEENEDSVIENSLLKNIISSLLGISSILRNEQFENKDEILDVVIKNMDEFEKENPKNLQKIELKGNEPENVKSAIDSLNSEIDKKLQNDSFKKIKNEKEPIIVKEEKENKEDVSSISKTLNKNHKEDKQIKKIDDIKENKEKKQEQVKDIKEKNIIFSKIPKVEEKPKIEIDKIEIKKDDNDNDNKTLNGFKITDFFKKEDIEELIDKKHFELNNKILNKNFPTSNTVPFNLGVISNLKRQFNIINQKTKPDSENFKNSKVMLDKLNYLQENFKNEISNTNISKDEFLKILSLKDEQLKKYFKQN